MDKLFLYEPDEMIKKIKVIEPEMREDSYGEITEGLDTTSRNALAYISEIFSYMKKNWNIDQCTVLALMKELYRIASTGEYSYLQDFEKISYKDDVFEHMWEEAGKSEILYAGRLLRYYYLVKEKAYHPHKTWKEIEKVYKKFGFLEPLKKVKKVEKVEKKEGDNTTTNTITDMEFMSECHAHMDKYYVGQDLLKKKMCSVLTQWKYYDVRTTMLMIGPSGSGKNYLIETISSFPYLGMPVISYDCSALTPNGFSGADVSAIFKKVREVTRSGPLFEWMRRDSDRPGSSDGKCIVYLDEIDKIINRNHDSRGDNINAMVQQQLLSALAGTETIEGVDTGKILFILGGAFPRIDELEKEKDRNPLGFNTATECKVNIKESVRDQMLAIGGEVEFIGRIEDIIRLHKLTRDELKTILMDEHIGIFTKKKKIYNDSGLDLIIEEDTVEAIVDLIVKENAGARSVKNIMNQFADNAYFYDMKVGGYSCMKIHKGMLQGEAPIFIKGGRYIENGARHF